MASSKIDEAELARRMGHNVKRGKLGEQEKPAEALAVA
jgi:hypothetical protein